MFPLPKVYKLGLQLFKRRNVATVEEDCALEDDGMSDSGYLESQANNMEQITVRALNPAPETESA